MATISGYNSYSMGVLFSGLNTTSSKNSLFSNSMSGSDILGINYSDGQQSDRAAILNC